MARLVTTKNSLIEKQPIHDHPPNIGRIDGKKFLSIRECLRYFPWNQEFDNSDIKNISVEYLDAFHEQK